MTCEGRRLGKKCGGWDSNPRRPTPQAPELSSFDMPQFPQHPDIVRSNLWGMRVPTTSGQAVIEADEIIPVPRIWRLVSSCEATNADSQQIATGILRGIWSDDSQPASSCMRRRSSGRIAIVPVILDICTQRHIGACSRTLALATCSRGALCSLLSLAHRLQSDTETLLVATRPR